MNKKGGTTMNKEEIVNLIKRVTEYYHHFESIEIEVKSNDLGLITIGYVAKVKSFDYTFIPIKGEVIQEVNFQHKLLIVASNFSTYNFFKNCDFVKFPDRPMS